MKNSYCICGLSTYGYRVAARLYAAGKEVLAIDNDREVVERIRDDVTQAVCADLRDRSVLRSVGVLDCSVAVIALPKNFDVAILTTHFLRGEGMTRIIAQVNTEEEAEALRVVGASDVVFPDRDVADRTVRVLTLPGLVDHFALSKDAGIVELGCPGSFRGRSILDLQIRKEYGVSVIGIKKAQDSSGVPLEHTIINPGPETVLEESDTIVVLGTSRNLSRFAEAVSRDG